MNNIKGYQQFESFSMKSIKGKDMVYCHGCKHTFKVPSPEPKKIVCPSCASMGLLSKGMAYLRPIERKF